MPVKVKPSVNGSTSPEVLTLPEAALFLRVSEVVLQAELEAGRIPARRIGADWRIGREALLQWLGSAMLSLNPQQIESTEEEIDSFLAQMQQLRHQWGQPISTTTKS